MTVITIRRSGVLVAFGPQDGAYDPIAPLNCTKQVEPDYNAVLAEWLGRPPKTDAEKDSELQAFLDSAGGRVVKALATVLIQKNVCTLAEIRTAYRSVA